MLRINRFSKFLHALILFARDIVIHKNGRSIIFCLFANFYGGLIFFFSLVPDVLTYNKYSAVIKNMDESMPVVGLVS